MGAPSDTHFILLYKPPCGKWYVHSHKLYPSVAAAYEAPKQFLHPETPFAVIPVNLDYLDTAYKILTGEMS